MAEASAIVSKQRPRLIEPGLPALKPGVERYPVRGGGAVVVAIEPGGVLEIVDLEGGQPAELVLFAPDGREDAAAIGARARHAPSGIQQILAGAGEDARRVRAGLERRRLDIGRAKAVRLFGDDSRPGETAQFRAGREAVAIIAAPGGPMVIARQNPPTDLAPFLRRAVIRQQSAPRLPEPLADPRLDLRIGIASAETYEVKAGEYVQIIDVAGRRQWCAFRSTIRKRPGCAPDHQQGATPCRVSSAAHMTPSVSCSRKCSA